MQKKLIALAVAAAAGSAFAQTNVTMYGIADVGYLNAKVNQAAGTGNVKFSGIQSGLLSTSRLGFRGTEDLGNGLKALFTVETALQLDANQTVGTPAATSQANSGVFGMNRQSYIGLSGGFGTVVAGRLQTPVSDFYSKYAPLGGSGALDPVLQVQTNAGQALAGSTDRVDSAVAFISPNFSGVTLKAAYSFLGEVKSDAVAKQSATVLSADYDNGPLSVGGVYRLVGDSKSNLVSNNDGNKQWSLGASYNFGVAKAFGTYQSAKFDTAGDKYKTYSLGVAVPVSAAGTVVASYAVSKDSNLATDTGAKGYTLAYTHGFSKRTTGYAGYTVLDGRKDQAANLASLGAAAADKKTSGFALGLRHSF